MLNFSWTSESVFGPKFAPFVVLARNDIIATWLEWDFENKDGFVFFDFEFSLLKAPQRLLNENIDFLVPFCHECYFCWKSSRRLQIHTLERSAQLISTFLVGIILNAHCIEKYLWIPSTSNPITPKFDFFGIVSIRYNANKVSV